MIELTLPWPPSANTYYRSTGWVTALLKKVLPRQKPLYCPYCRNRVYAQFRNSVLISKKGREYRRRIQNQAILERWPRFKDAKVRVRVDAFPPDRRRRDIMNVEKCLNDSLEAALVFNDDFQIDSFRIDRCHVVKGGLLKVRIEEI